MMTPLWIHVAFTMGISVRDWRNSRKYILQTNSSPKVRVSPGETSHVPSVSMNLDWKHSISDGKVIPDLNIWGLIPKWCRVLSQDSGLETEEGLKMI
jgi:hypothetical protein